MCNRLQSLGGPFFKTTMRAHLMKMRPRYWIDRDARIKRLYMVN